MRTVIVIASLFLLAGCSQMPDDIFDFGSDMSAQAADAQPAPQPVTVATQSRNDAFCQSVAKQDSLEGAFDAPTQQRVYQRSYAQCLALYGS